MARSSRLAYKNPYGAFQTHAEQELELLRQERERLGQRMAEVDERERQLREYLKAITPLMANGPGKAPEEVGVTKLCRQIIDNTPRWVTAQEVRMTLSGMGVDISSYTSPTSVLHSILHRVAACRRDAEGKLYFGRRDLVKPPGSQVVGPSPSDRKNKAVAKERKQEPNESDTKRG
jgi:hypothetical protein